MIIKMCTLDLHQSLAYIGSVDNFLPLPTSTAGTCFSSASIEASLGSFPLDSEITTRCNLAEVVFLRSEANCASSSIKCSERLQFRNAMVVNKGEDDGFDNKVERQGMPVWDSTTSVSRRGKNDKWCAMGLRWGLFDVWWCVRRNSRTLVRGSRGNSVEGSFLVCEV